MACLVASITLDAQEKRTTGDYIPVVGRVMVRLQGIVPLNSPGGNASAFVVKTVSIPVVFLT